MQEDVRLVAPADQAVLVQVLVRAFGTDPVLRWIIPRQIDYDRIAPQFFGQILRQNHRDGASLTTGDQSGVSLWTGPNRNQSFFLQLLAFVRTYWLLRSHFERAMRLQDMLATYPPKKPFWHLTYIATEPNRQRTGVGGRLLRPMLERAAEAGLPVYLECSNEGNLSFYRAHGFRSIDRISHGDAPVIWPMIHGG